jgi:hypothetical protein
MGDGRCPPPLSPTLESARFSGSSPPKNALTRLHAGGGGGRHTRRNILVGCHVLREGSTTAVSGESAASR